MSINLAEIQQKVNRLLYNIAEQNRRAYQLFYDPNPQDVELPQLDENGNLTTVKIPNRAKIKAEVDGFIAGAEKKFIKGMYYKEFDTPIEIPGTGQYSVMLNESTLDTSQLNRIEDDLGFADNWELKNPYQYSTIDDYSPQVTDGKGNSVNCFATINIHNFPIIPNDAMYLVLKTVVEGHSDYTQYTPIDVLRYEEGTNTYWKYPDHYNSPFLLISGKLVYGRNWGWNYRDTCIIKMNGGIGYGGYGTSHIRVINRGNRKLTLFGIGIIYK